MKRSGLAIGWGLAVVTSALGCSSDAALDGRNAFGSGATVTSADFNSLYVASADDDILAKVDVATGAVVATNVPGEPTRVTRIGDRVFVTLRAARSIVELEDRGTELVEVRRVEVGPEPVGIVASEDGTSLYVAVSMADRVLEVDPTTLKTSRVWDIENEPRWLALHPKKTTLFVAPARGHVLVEVDLESGDATEIDLRVMQGLSRGRGFGPSRT